MAMAQKWLANRYNRPGLAIFDYNVYAVCGDGCMMEGIASEAASLAAHLGLDNLCWVYDNNHITIEGNTRIAFTEDVAARFLGYGWNVLRVGDANDIGRIENALRVFQQTKGRPTFIIIESHIGYGSPHKQDTAEAHGEPLGDEEIRLTKRAYGWPEDSKFLVPDGVYEHFKAGIGKRGAETRQAPRFRSGERCVRVLGDAPGGKPEIILIASGSEVSLAASAREKLISEGIASRLVSMPSWDIFESQTQEYRNSVLPPHVTVRIAVEQASTFGWERYIGSTGRVIGMKTFGASAPLKELQRKYGFEPENVVAAAKELLGRG